MTNRPPCGRVATSSRTISPIGGPAMCQRDECTSEAQSAEDPNGEKINFKGMDLERLLKAARAGSKEALAEAVESYRFAVTVVLERMVRVAAREQQGRARPSDLFQELHVEVQCGFHNFQGRT